MNEELLKAMTDIDDEFLLEADEYKAEAVVPVKKRRNTWLGIAACIAVLVILAIPLSKISLSKDGNILNGAGVNDIADYSSNSTDDSMFGNAEESLGENINKTEIPADKDMESYSSSYNTAVNQTVEIDGVKYRIECTKDDSIEDAPLVVTAYIDETNEFIVSKMYEGTEYNLDDFLNLLKDSVS